MLDFTISNDNRGVNMSSSLFDELIARQNTSSLKWDAMHLIYGEKDLLPMWVADMDFPSPQGIQEAIIDRVRHPIFGYTTAANEVYESIIHWLDKHHNWQVEKSSISFSSGVVASIATTIQAFTEPGDKVLVQTPVYNPFFDMIKANNREVVNNQLVLEEDTYFIDFADFEEKIQSGVKMFLLCSPHNPGGRIWTKAELQKIAEICLKHHVVIVSDEIHADLFHSNQTHYPLASLSEEIAQNTVTLMAPSKTFNIAGLHASFIISENKKLQKKIKQVQMSQGFFGLNALALTAMEAAYRVGEEWLHEVILYIEENFKVAEQFIAEELPKLRCMKSKASYLLWINCRALGLTDKEIQKSLIQKGKLALEPGNKYGAGGEGFIRMNLGCSRTTLLDGLHRLKKALA